MSNYLFTLTITPVQSFITQARKTKDLFAGSEILSKLIEKALEQVEKKDIIFPHDTEIVSNKFVISLHNKTEKEVEALGAKLKNCINKTCINLIFEHTKLYDNFYDNFFQVFWVAVELTDDYQQSYKRLEQSLGAVKNIRVFEQEEQEGDRKCSLCGERNGAFYKYRVNEKGKQIVPKYISKKAIVLKENNTQGIDFNQIKDNETLCPICFTKRFYKGFTYPSTEDISNDNKYYALIQLDIDDMGKHLSNAKDIEEQRGLSEKLGEFAKNAKEIVSQKYTIYAGGDDFLGFVELDNLFDTIAKIKESFNIPNITFSTAIVIAHEKASLHKVLDYSRELLAQTKSHFDDKNGVGIIVMSSNALNAKTVCRYNDLPLLKDMRDKKIGMNLHYKLNSTFNFLDSMNFDDYLTHKQMIKTEIKRLLKKEEKEFNQNIYERVCAFFDNQNIKLSSNSYEIDFDNFIGFLKTLEQLKKVM